MSETSYSFYQPAEPVRDIERELPVEVVSIGRAIESGPDYRWTNERHGRARYHIFQYTLAGKGVFEYRRDGERRREEVGRSKMFIASWDESFAYSCARGGDYEFIWIIMMGEFADRAARALRQPSPVLQLAPRAAPALVIEGMLERLAAPPRLDRYALTCLGYEFLAQTLKATSKSTASPEESFLMEARDFVVRHARSASVASLAGHFGYDDKYFNDYFKKRSGTTPNRFIVEQRLRYASSLLAGTRMSVAEVANACGFSEDNYFSKVFKRHSGLSPSAFRERSAGTPLASDVVVL
jgi:AraC-type DNA-binding domain-containing proteins